MLRETEWAAKRPTPSSTMSDAPLDPAESLVQREGDNEVGTDPVGTALYLLLDGQEILEILQHIADR